MSKAVLLVALLVGVPAAAAGQAGPSEAPQVAEALSDIAPAPACKSSDPAEVVVCGRSQQRYRIDRNVLAAARAAEAPPPKPPLDASVDHSCTGANCGGGMIPLVGMALTALRAAELAAQGDDWREAFRTHPDQYQAYQQSKAAQKKGAVSIAVRAGNQ